MERLQSLSIDRKLMWIIMGTSSAALLLATFAFAAHEFVAARRILPQRLVSLAEMVAVNSQGALSFNQPKAAQETLDTLRTQSEILTACTYTPAGQVVAQYRRADQPAGLTPRALENAGFRFERDRLVLFHRVEFDEEWIGTICLEADLRGLYAGARRYASIAALVLIASSALAFGLSIRLRRLISEPILHLARTAGHVASEKNYSIRARKSGHDEIGQLVDGFNEMLGQIQARDRALEEAREELEHRVEARTLELSKANALLKQEIREREQAEAAQQKQVALIQNCQDFIGIVTLAGRVDFLNDAGRRLVGLDPKRDVRQTSMAEYFPEATQVHWRETILPEALKAGSWVGDTKLRHCKSAEAIPVYMSVFVIRDPQTAGPICLATVTRDMTDHLNLEAQLRQAQKMEAIGQLAAGVAHDFNNIMTIIQGYTALVLASDSLGRDATESLQHVSTAADRAANLTRQLLTFSRKQAMQSRPLDLNEAVGRVTAMLGRLLGDHIIVECQYASRMAVIEADAGMIDQLITNLAVNARDAMPNGGRLSLGVHVQMIGADQAKLNPEARPGRFVTLTVTDSGCGMAPATLAKLFEPFFTTKEVGKGTGLGLASVYGIVKQHQGWIEVASEVERGSTFLVYFPASAKLPAETKLNHAPSQVPLGGEETILLVEDEPSLRRLAREVLEHYGYKVFDAGTGVEALAIWQRHGSEIDLLLTDMVLPQGINGRDLAERLRREKEQLRVIYTSGYIMDVSVQSSLTREGVVTLPKPYQPATLAKAVRSAFDSASNL